MIIQIMYMSIMANLLILNILFGFSMILYEFDRIHLFLGLVGKFNHFFC